MATFFGDPITRDFQVGGFDTMFGYGGDDNLGADQPGLNTIDGGSGSDILFIFGDAASTGLIHGGDDNDLVIGNDLGDELHGDAGDDVVAGTTAETFSNGFTYLFRPLQASGQDTLYGEDGRDGLYGFDGGDLIYGGTGNDAGDILAPKPGSGPFDAPEDLETFAGLWGGDGNDFIYGGSGDDGIYGGVGKDKLFGGAGADGFVIERKKESPKGAADVIKDFARKQGDVLVLQYMDANINKSGDQAFDFIGKKKFSGEAGELRFHKHVLSGDVNGNAKPDFEVKIPDPDVLSSGDFVL